MLKFMLVFCSLAAVYEGICTIVAAQHGMIATAIFHLVFFGLQSAFITRAAIWIMEK